MAPPRTSVRHPLVDQNIVPRPSVQEPDIEHVNTELFIDLMLGTPLAMYIEKDVEEKDNVAALITKHGGTVSPGYSGVPYILVNPHKPSGQNLWRQYTGKKGKIVLDSRWVHECVKANQLQTFATNWAGCKVTGTETVTPAQESQPAPPPPAPETAGRRRSSRQKDPAAEPARQIQALPPSIPALGVDPFAHPQGFPYHQVYGPMDPPPRAMHAPTPAPPQTWQASGAIAPQQTHIAPPHMLNRPPDTWGGYDHAAPHTGDEIPAPGYDYRYRDDQTGWVPAPNPYYDAQYDQAYEHAAYMQEPAANAAAGPSTTGAVEPAEKPRGRKRTRTQPAPAAPAATLVMNKNPPARSPTPPTRVIKSTYGGNLFTADDVHYLKKYIDYCQEQGLVLSLREICEKIAIKAPHHTFFSWRRYCNKHQIRLGGYMMNADRSESPNPEGGNQEIEEEEIINNPPGPGTVAAAQQQRMEAGAPRNRSPTPPRALFRSTTGKGVAFTDEDITFLVRFMDYRKSQGRLDMVTFWKEVAIKAPHHSRASWMKFWRRHKHELTRTETDEPLPPPPEKKMRYSRDDDILLAKYFFDKPEGISDKIFQAFARQYPHHPWKGWQEHHRIHKPKIDHFMQMLANGESLDGPPPPSSSS